MVRMMMKMGKLIIPMTQAAIDTMIEMRQIPRKRQPALMGKIMMAMELSITP